MTTPPQGPWGPGQPGGQPGGQHGGQGNQPPQQGGWGQQPPGQGGWGQNPQQPGQPPRQDQPSQGGWGQQPGQPGHGQPGQGQPGQGQPGQFGQPSTGGWGQQSQGGSYQQQPWGQRSQQQDGGWHQQQGGPGQQWQPGGPGSKGPGGISKEKLPLLIGGGVVGVVLLGLLIFLGVRAFSGDDEPVSEPTTTSEPTGSNEPEPTGSPTSGGDKGGELGKASGQAKSVTDKLQGAGFGCSDLFNTGQGAHRGCFKTEGSGKGAEALFQFTADGSIIAVRLEAQDNDNFNNAQVAFDQVLQALGNETFGGDQVKKIQEAVKTGQRSETVGTTWGEFRLSNSGQSVRITGHKSGEESLELPDQKFDTTQTQLQATLKAKGYTCTSSCKKDIGKYGYQRIFIIDSRDQGINQLEVSVSGDAADTKKALPTVLNDAFGSVQGGNVAAVKAWINAHNDGKPHAAYVGGWRIEIEGNGSGDYGSQRISVNDESFFA